MVGWLALPAFATLFMIKFRCTAGPYPCGFMSFTGGFSGHWLLGAVLFLGGWTLAALALSVMSRLAWRVWMERLGRGITPLLGLWVAVAWETLPISIIHPPSHGGPCPDLPIICHDLPLLGLGGLAYWGLPFVLWAAGTTLVDLMRAFRDTRGPA